MNTENQASILDADKDALHILPLGMLPFETQALKRARTDELQPTFL